MFLLRAALLLAAICVGSARAGLGLQLISNGLLNVTRVEADVNLRSTISSVFWGLDGDDDFVSPNPQDIPLNVGEKLIRVHLAEEKKKIVAIVRGPLGGVRAHYRSLSPSSPWGDLVTSVSVREIWVGTGGTVLYSMGSSQSMRGLGNNSMNMMGGMTSASYLLSPESLPWKGPDNYHQLYVGEDHIVVVKGPNVYIAGDNSRGTLGLGHSDAILSSMCDSHLDPSGSGTCFFAMLPSLSHKNISHVTEGFAYSESLGMLFSYGDNSHGQRCTNIAIPLVMPVQVGPPGLMLQDVQSRGTRTLLLATNGTLFGCGENGPYNLIVNGTDRMYEMPTETNFFAGRPVGAIALGPQNTMVRLALNDQVYIWGSNEYGLLGDTAQVDAAEPVLFTQLIPEAEFVGAVGLKRAVGALVSSPFESFRGVDGVDFAEGFSPNYKWSKLDVNWDIRWRVMEMDASKSVVKSYEMPRAWEGELNSTSGDVGEPRDVVVHLSGRLENGAKVLFIFSWFGQPKQVDFAGVSLMYPTNKLKIAIEVSEWPHEDPSNFVRIRADFSVNQDITVNNSNTPDVKDWDCVVGNTTLNVRSITKVVVAGAAVDTFTGLAQVGRFVEFTVDLPPGETRPVMVDPDMSILFTPQSDDSSCCAPVGPDPGLGVPTAAPTEEAPPLSVAIIVVIALVAVLAVAALIILPILAKREKEKRNEQMKKRIQANDIAEAERQHKKTFENLEPLVKKEETVVEV